MSNGNQNDLIVQLLTGGGGIGAAIGAAYVLIKRIVPSLVNARVMQIKEEHLRDKQREDRLFDMIDANLERQEERDDKMIQRFTGIELSLRLLQETTQTQNEFLSHFINGKKKNK